MSRWSRRLGRIPNTLRRAQRTYGTTDPGGVWHPVHRRECLTILSRYLRRKWTMQSTDDELHCIRYSLLVPCPSASVPTDWYLRVEKQSTTLYRPGLVHSD